MPAWMSRDDGSLQRFLDGHQAPKERQYVRYFAGVDLGRKRDPSTLAIIEVRYGPPRSYVVAFLKRFRLSMLYTDIAQKLVQADARLKEIAAKQGKEAIISYVLDATGLGGPICELVEKALPLADVKRVYITGGINTTEGAEYNEWHVPKGQLISGLVANLDAQTLFMTRRSKEIDQIVTELAEFEIHITEAGREIYEDRGKGHHSDLLIALSLAVWAADSDGYNGGPMVWGG